MSETLFSTCTSAYVKLLSGFSTFQATLTGGTRLSFTGRGGAERQSRLLVSTTAEAVAEKEREKDIEVLQKGIAELYDESSGLWENIWGEHMHHGFYDPDSTVSLSDHRAAQIRMIEESLSFASVSSWFLSLIYLCVYNVYIYIHVHQYYESRAGKMLS